MESGDIERCSIFLRNFFIGSKKCGAAGDLMMSKEGAWQALAGSRDLQSAKIPGFSKLKSRDFSGFFVAMFWTPWNAL